MEVSVPFLPEWSSQVQSNENCMALLLSKPLHNWSSGLEKALLFLTRTIADSSILLTH